MSRSKNIKSVISGTTSDDQNRWMNFLQTSFSVISESFIEIEQSSFEKNFPEKNNDNMEKKAITVRSSDETKVLYKKKQYKNNKEIINDDNYRQL